MEFNGLNTERNLKRQCKEGSSKTQLSRGFDIPKKAAIKLPELVVEKKKTLRLLGRRGGGEGLLFGG